MEHLLPLNKQKELRYFIEYIGLQVKVHYLKVRFSFESTVWHCL